jgi:acetyltransferase
MALVAIYTHPDTGEQEILGIGRLNKLHGRNEAEFALLVSDKWQGRGLGKEFLTRLVQVGKLEGLTKVEGFIHPENMDMQRVSEKVGFKRSYSIEDGLVKVVMNL